MMITKNNGTRTGRGILAPPQVTFDTVKDSSRGRVRQTYRTVTTGIPEKPYLPADPGRRERLLAAIKTMNEGKDE
jgi:hypothetical protein